MNTSALLSRKTVSSELSISRMMKSTNIAGGAPCWPKRPWLGQVSGQRKARRKRGINPALRLAQAASYTFFDSGKPVDAGFGPRLVSLSPICFEEPRSLDFRQIVLSPASSTLLAGSSAHLMEIRWIEPRKFRKLE